MIKVLKEDLQYIIPTLAIVIIFIGTDFLGFLSKYDFAYLSGKLLNNPYRLITSHFFHADFDHLIANTFGIVIARFFLRELKLMNKYLFIMLTLILIPLQAILQVIVDILLGNYWPSALIGFSGILYGVDAFILLSAKFGKRKFLIFEIGLIRNLVVFRSMIVLTCFGIAWSFLPGVSLTAHLTGFLGGSLLFLL